MKEVTNNNNKRVAYFTRRLVRELFVNFARHYHRVLVLKSLINEYCNKKAWLLSYALLYHIVIIHIYKKTFHYSEITTLERLSFHYGEMAKSWWHEVKEEYQPN